MYVKIRRGQRASAGSPCKLAHGKKFFNKRSMNIRFLILLVLSMGNLYAATTDVSAKDTEHIGSAEFSAMLEMLCPEDTSNEPLTSDVFKVDSFLDSYDESGDLGPFSQSVVGMARIVAGYFSDNQKVKEHFLTMILKKIIPQFLAKRWAISFSDIAIGNCLKAMSIVFEKTADEYLVKKYYLDVFELHKNPFIRCKEVVHKSIKQCLDSALSARNSNNEFIFLDLVAYPLYLYCKDIDASTPGLDALLAKCDEEKLKGKHERWLRRQAATLFGLAAADVCKNKARAEGKRWATM